MNRKEKRKIDNIIKEVLTEKCDRCEKELACDLHVCPYNDEINGDSETLCNCCDNCKQLCADGI